MKRFLWLGALLIAITPLSSVSAHPNGRSAIMAARLEKHADGWLSWYLPDDRYKIAGGVWKYVSTDLDTYYHRPNSPNIFRQSKDHIIGFATAKDAEDAGYLPDPTDGTGSMVGSFGSGVSRSSTPAELRYEQQVMDILVAVATQGSNYMGRLSKWKLSSSPQNDLAGLAAGLSASAASQAKVAAANAAKMKRIKPPARYAAFHKQTMKLLQEEVSMMNILGKVGQGDFRYNNVMMSGLVKFMNTAQKWQAEANKSGMPLQRLEQAQRQKAEQFLR